MSFSKCATTFYFQTVLRYPEALIYNDTAYLQYIFCELL